MRRTRINNPEAPRVLHILSVLRPSGAEVMIAGAAPRWFNTAGGHGILATGEAEGPYADTLKKAGFAVWHIPFHKSIRYFLRVLVLIWRERFEVVHIHTEQAIVFYGFVAKLAGGRRIIHTVHNVFPFTGTLRLFRIVMRWGLRQLGSTEVAIGASVAENEARNFFNPTLVIPNWYNEKVFRPPSAEERRAARAGFGLLSDCPVIATLGNCNEWKNHPLLFRALALLTSRGQDWYYLHAGAEDPRESERTLAAELGVAARCSFLGSTDDPRTVMWAADIFVMPSLREGLGNAAIEAAACGLPLVLTDAPGLKDLKSTFKDGFWVEPEPSALADAIDAARRIFPAGSPTNANASRAAYGTEVGASAYYALYRGNISMTSDKHQEGI